jgi:hypothetical protein
LLWRFACLIVCLLWRFVVGADFLFCNLHRDLCISATDSGCEKSDPMPFLYFRFYASLFFGVCTVMFLVFLGTNFSFPCFHRLLLSLSNLPHTTLQVSWYGSCRFAIFPIEGTTPSGHSRWGFPFFSYHS